MLDLSVAVAGLLVGSVVGLTGMGGGALMTPVLVLLFGVPPLTAVSSDLVASMIMKPVGGGVHLRRGTVNRALVGWLALGSVPAAFAGVLLLRLLGTGAQLDARLKLALGGALLVAAAALLLKGVLAPRATDASTEPVRIRPLPTVLIGAAGGLVVGMTSVGSGSLMIVLLLLLYPRLRLAELVGTDLVQAVPLVASAAVAHLVFGHVELALSASVLLGALPGVYLGARLSSRAPDVVLRPALITVLAASSLKLLGAGTPLVVGLALGAGACVTLVMLVRRSPAGAPRASRGAPERAPASS